MTFRIALPDGGRTSTLDLVDPNTSAVQRFLRRHGLAGYEPSTVAALLASFERATPGFGFLDVGANIGLYSSLCAAMFEPGWVVAVEPVPDLARLTDRIAHANGLTVDVRRVAASGEVGVAELHLADATDVSNSLEAGFKKSSTSISVDTIPLDSMFTARHTDPAIVKIDVEGHEAAVLGGAGDLLARSRPTIVIEVLNRRGGRLADAISAAIDGLGYHCYELSPEPTWHCEGRVRSADAHRDWLLLPEPIDDEFIASWRSWHRRVGACTPDRNSRVPILRTTWAAFRRGGVSEVSAALLRFVRR